MFYQLLKHVIPIYEYVFMFFAEHADVMQYYEMLAILMCIKIQWCLIFFYHTLHIQSVSMFVFCVHWNYEPIKTFTSKRWFCKCACWDSTCLPRLLLIWKDFMVADQTCIFNNSWMVLKYQIANSVGNSKY